MKYQICTVLFLIGFTACSPVSTSFTKGSSEFTISQHRKVAILPYEPHYKTSRRDANARFKDWNEQYMVSGLFVQKHFFLAFAKRIRNGKVNLAIQSFVETNEILEKAGIVNAILKTIDKKALCKLLDVDAVILCEIDSELGNIRMQKPNGVIIKEVLSIVTGNIYDGSSGSLVWQKQFKMKPYLNIDTPDRLARFAIRDIVSLLPY